MCFTVAQYLKIAQARMRYLNARNKAREAEERYVASAFEHPELLIVKQEQEEPVLDSASWGLIPSWCKTDEEAKELSNITINARCETLFEKPSFRDSVKHRRCLLPVNGFFEYHQADKKKIPYYISLKNADIFSIGALYSIWTSTTTGKSIQTLSVITTDANPLLATIHNTKLRMPLIIPVENERDWLQHNLSENEIKGFLKPYPEDNMQAWMVNPIISKGKAINSHISIEPRDNLLSFNFF